MTFEFKMTAPGKLDATNDIQVGGKVVRLTLRAENVRRTRDGSIVGLVKFAVATTVVYSDDGLFMEKDSDRHQFANRLYGTRQTPAILSDTSLTSAYPIQQFEHDFMIWAGELWNEWIGPSSGEYVAGDADPSSPPWVIPGLVMRNSPAIWAGNAGAGKSTLMRIVAQSLSLGWDGVFSPHRAENVIWVNAEESPEEHTRQLGNANAALGLSRAEPLYTIDARGMRVEDLALRVKAAVEKEDAQHVFIDSLSRLAQGLSLNNNETATLLIDSLAGLGCSTNWVGHTGHENRQRLSGSKHFENAARVMVLIQSRLSLQDFSKRGFRVRAYKANGAPPTEPQHFEASYHEQYGLQTFQRSEASRWPVLNCEHQVETAKGMRNCGTRTWEGTALDGRAYCSRHENEEREE